VQVRRAHIWLIVLVEACLLFSACVRQTTGTGSTPDPPATPGTELSADLNDTGWTEIGTALEFRRVRLQIGQQSGELAILRLDPKAYHIRVAYDAAHPGRVSEWAAAVKPVALINGGYFDAEGKATALVIFDGIVRGASYEGFGGMVVVNEQGDFELRSLRHQPYDPNEPLRQAMQSAPMLIQPGGTLSELDADEDRSRRTVIARDRSGRILMIACDWATFTLAELAALLQESDLELDAALNLDGGRSTGMFVDTPTMRFTMDSFETVPLVLIVDAKQ
jgi:exopolysaccharide biosynthesis protein